MMKKQEHIFSPKFVDIYKFFQDGQGVIRT